MPQVNTRRGQIEASPPRSPSPDVISAAGHLDDDWGRLNASQRRNIQRVFEKYRSGRNKSKKSIVNDSIDNNDSAGGFLPEDEQNSSMGGGFIPDGSSTEPAGGGGGFIPEPDEAGQGGGFMVEESNSDDDVPQTELNNSLPLSRIKAALIALHLDENDDQVLEIFQQAASGWGSASAEADADAALIPWQDFASVAAVLVSQRDADKNDADNSSDEEDDDVYKQQPDEDDEEMEGVSEVESDGISDVVEDEQVVDDLGTSKKRKVTQKQHESSLDTFRLFFSNPDSVTEDSKMSLSDLSRVIKSLNEKISDTQVGI